MNDKFALNSRNFLNQAIYWLIVALPFSMAIAPAPMNICMGLLVCSFLLKKVLTREPIAYKTALTIPFICFFVISLLSIQHSVSLKDSLKGGVLRLTQYALVMLAIISEIKDTRHLKRIIYSMLAGACLVSADGLWQITQGKDFIRGNLPVINIGLKRATASFKDSNLMGIYLSAIAGLSFTMAHYYYRGRRRFLMIAVTLLIFSGVAITYSRPTLLAVFISLLFLAFIKKDRLLKWILIVMLLLSPFFLPKSVKEWARLVEYNPIRFMCNDDRISVYLTSLEMIRQHPFIGVGLNNYMKKYRLYKPPVEYRNIVTPDYMYAHNIYLHMASEIGLIGLGFFLWLLYGLFTKTIALYRKLKDILIKNIALGILACILAFLVNGLTESSLYYSSVALIFWYLAGLSLALDKFS